MCPTSNLTGQQRPEKGIDMKYNAKPAFVGTSAAPCSACSECECATWCDLDHRIRLLTGHHADCEHGGRPFDAALALIDELVKGMESWAHDEDGIHPDAWESYRKAKALFGMHLPPANEGLSVQTNDQAQFRA